MAKDKLKITIKDISKEAIDEQQKQGVAQGEGEGIKQSQRMKRGKNSPMLSASSESGTFSGGGRGYSQQKVWGEKPQPPGMPVEEEAPAPSTPAPEQGEEQEEGQGPQAPETAPYDEM